MSTSVDQKIVSMKFDNSQFEKGVKTTLGSIKNLNHAFDGFKNNNVFDALQKSIDHVNFDSMYQASSDLVHNFGLLGRVADKVFDGIASKITSIGKNLAASFITQPITDGFHEYETQMGAIQTIMANTSEEFQDATEQQHLDTVNDALNTLNTYADKTIYNFTEMTRNIGTFTAAGVKLQDSVDAIQGIANLAAVSGSTSQQASTAMYQLSQALAAGTVKLQDWNSVVNAGMGGQVFQKALMRTAKVLKSNDEEVQDIISSIEAGDTTFRETLSKGWITSDVLTETLHEFTMSAEEGSDQWNEFKKELMDTGYTEDAATEILKFANTATDAATKVRTFSQLIDTLKEAVGSGWTQTWQLILGDFDQATNLFTDINDVLSDFVNKTSNARNDLLEDWADLGGRDELIKSLKDAVAAFGAVLKPVVNALKDASGVAKITGKSLLEMTKNLDVVVKKFTLSEEASRGLYNIFRALGTVVKIIANGLKAVGDVALTVAQNIFKTVDAFLRFFTSENDTADATSNFSKMLDNLVDVTNKVFTGLSKIANFMINVFGGVVANAIKGIASLVTNFIEATHVVDGLKNVLAGLSTVADHVNAFFVAMWIDVGQMLERIEDSKPFKTFINNVKSLGETVKNVIGAPFVAAGNAVSNFVGQFSTEKLTPAMAAHKVFTSLGNAIIFLFDKLNQAATFIKTTVAPVIEKYLLKAINSVSEALKGLFGGDFGTQFKSIGEFFTSIFASIKNAVKGFDPKILLTPFQFIGSAIKSLFENLNKGKNLPEAFKAMVDGLRTQFAPFFDVVDKIAEGFKKLGSIALGKGKEGLSGLIEWMKGQDLKSILSYIKTIAQIFKLVRGAKALKSAMGMFDSIGDFFGSFDKMAKGAKMKGIAAIIIGVAAIIATITASLVILTHQDLGKMQAATANLVGVLVIVGAMIAALAALAKWKNVSFADIGVIFIGIGVAALAIVLALKKMIPLAQADPKAFIGCFIALGALLVVIALVATRSKKAGTAAKSATPGFGSIIGMLIALALLPKILNKIKDFDPKIIIDHIGSFIAIFGVLIALAAISHFAGEGGKGIAQMMIALIMTINMMSKVTKIMGKMKGGELAKGIIAIGVFLGGITAILWQAKKIDEKQANALAGVIKSISVAVGVMAAAVFVIGRMKWGDMLKGFLPIGVMLGEIALIINQAKGIGKGGIVAIIAIAGVIAELAVIIKLLVDVPWQSAIVSMGSIALVLGVMTAMLAQLSKIQNSNIPGMVVAVGLMSALLWELVGAFKVVQDAPWQTLLASSAAMALALTSLVTAVMILQGFQPEAIKNVGAGIVALDLVLADLLGVVELFGLIGTDENLENLQRGGEVAEALGSAVGKFVGGIVGGALEGMTDSLPEVATNLSTFMTNLQPFIDGLKGLNSDSVTAVGALSDVVLKLTAADFIQGIGKFLGIGGNLGQFATDLSSLGAAVKGYSDSLGGDVDGDKIKKSAEAVKALADVQKELGGKGGIKAKIFGEGEDLGQFSANLAALGAGLVAYSASLSVGKVDPEAIEKSAEAVKSLVDVENAIDEKGGALGKIIGKSDFSTFGKNLTALGDALADYSKALTEDDGVNLAAINNSLSAVQKLVELETAMQGTDNSGGFISWFTGDNDLGSLNSGLKELGKALVGYSNEITKDGADINIDAINKSVHAAQIIAELKDVGLGDINLEGVGKQMEAFGTSLMSFSTTIDGLDISKINQVVPAVNSLATGVVDAITSYEGKFSSAMTDAANEGVQGFLIGIQNGHTNALHAGQALGERVVNGIKENSSKAKTAAGGMVIAAMSGIKGYYNGFYNAGGYLVKGFANGIRDSSFLAERQASYMASKSKEAVDKTLIVASPSKALYKTGRWTAIGFANGIKDFAHNAVESATNMAQSVIDAFGGPTETLADIVNGEFEENPTITPVVDLSNVYAAADGINSSFPTSAALAFDANQSFVSPQTRMRNAMQDTAQTMVDNYPTYEPANDQFTINVPLDVNGRQFAKATATFTRDELNKIDKFNNRKKGIRE